MELFFHTLENGIRLVHRRIPGIVAHCGLFINAGSRDEKPEQYGIAHFIEHMLFKGTRKRKAYYVISMLEDVGGELNAYTTKEDTIIYASFLTEHYGKAVELISDIAFNSVFPEKEIEKEKDVVLEEIHSYLDNPAELIFDEFEEMVFAGQPVAHNILGTVDTVRSFTRKQLFEFVSEQYRADDMVFCSVGDISDEKILRLFRSCFSQAMPGKKNPQKEMPWQYRPATVTKVLNTYQNHCIIGNIAYNIKDKRRMSLFLLNNILGGQGMNSRLNISMREKRGLAYNVESTYNPYIDTGLFTIYFGSDANNLEKSISVAMAE
ncbi:MAG: insulinase family protein, partial [Bacteroidales bacterium]|nr:insulinase family protein [Bacteroidales bacterium]